MKPNAILINTARGPLIKESDLVDALNQGRIAGAGLDVYEHEPMMAEDLADMANTVLVPHIGSATHRARNDMSLLAAENVLAVLRGGAPKACVNPEVLAQR